MIDVRDKSVRPLTALVLLSTLAMANSGCHTRDPVSPPTYVETPSVDDDPPAITDADWSMYNQDVKGWRFNRGEQTLAPENAGSLELKWRFPSEASGNKIGVVHATPSVVNSHVYFGTATDPAFYKLKPDGSIAWVYRIDSGKTDANALPLGGANLINGESGVMTSALVTGDAVYFGNSVGVLFALDRITGWYRGRSTVLHLPAVPSELPRLLRDAHRGTAQHVARPHQDRKPADLLNDFGGRADVGYVRPLRLIDAETIEE